VLHDLTGAIADFEAHDIAQTLLVRQIERPAIMTMGEQALVDNIDSSFWPQPLAHCRLRGVRQARITQS